MCCWIGGCASVHVLRVGASCSDITICVQSDTVFVTSGMPTMSCLCDRSTTS